MNQTKLSLAALVLAVIALVLAIAGRMGSAAGGDWLPAAPKDQLRVLETHLRGLDVTMFEIGYRFTELYFAGQDRNWAYAQYHAEKIDLACGWLSSVARNEADLLSRFSRKHCRK